MKLIEQINVKVVSIVYDEMKDAHIASLNKSVPVPVLYADKIIYEKRASMYLELGSVDVTSIDEGDIITIQLFEHYPGEQVELFGGEYHTFATAGYHNFISAIEYHTDEIGWDEIEAADIARHTSDPAPTVEPTKHYVGYFAIDNWHMVGGHFPSVKPTSIYDNLDECLDILMRDVDSYRIEDSHHKRITREDIVAAVNANKYGYACIHFEYPREGEVTIISNC